MLIQKQKKTYSSLILKKIKLIIYYNKFKASNLFINNNSSLLIELN